MPEYSYYRWRLPGLRTARYCCLIFLLAGFSACHFTFTEKFSSPLWFYRYSSNTPSKWDTVLTRASFLELRPDGSYTQDFGHFDYGNWALKGQDLYLTNQHHTTYIFRLLAVGEKEMEIYLAKGKIAYFEKQPRPSGRASKDPFSPENNLWHIRATHKRNKINWPDTDDECKLFVSGIQQVEGFLK